MIHSRHRPDQRTGARLAAASRPSARRGGAHLSALGNQAAQHHRRNDTGLPDGLRTGIETLSGLDLADVRVHRNSSEPARLHAYAFTRGRDIHLAPYQEQQLPHEAWHVVQQKQGRVRRASRPPQAPMNADPALEHEAARMGRRAVAAKADPAAADALQTRSPTQPVVQMAPNQAGTADPAHLLDMVRRLEAEGLTREQILDRISEAHAGNDQRYIYTDRYGWIDLRHFGAAGSLAQGWGSVVTEGLGFGNEVLQWATEWGDDYRSGFSPEDIPSNAAGAEFGDDYVSEDEPLSDSLERWLQDAGARRQSDRIAGRDNLPATDPSARGGADRGSSNASRTQSTVSDNAPVNDFVNEWNRGWRALSTPEGWYRLFAY
jgi:hypothetical protein